MDKELKMKLLQELMDEMDETSMTKFKKGDDIMPEGGMVKVKEVKEDIVPASKASSMIEEKMAEAMKKDGMESEGEEMEEEDEDEYEGSSLMQKLKALKKGA